MSSKASPYAEALRLLDGVHSSAKGHVVAAQWLRQLCGDHKVEKQIAVIIAGYCRVVGWDPDKKGSNV